MSHKKIEWTQVNRRNDNNWPDQRFNWGSMSNGQKDYTIRQYNKYRTNAGLPRIPNPWRKGIYGEGSKKYQIPPGGALAKKYPKYVGVETITPASTNEQLLPDDNIYSFVRRDRPSTTTMSSIDIERQELELMFNDKVFLSNLNKALKNDPNMSSISIGDQPGTSGVQTRGQKRKQDTQATPSSAPEQPAAMPTSAPGTGHDTDMEIGGASQASNTKSGTASAGLASQAAEMNIHVDKPLTVSGVRKVHFSKVHRFLSYGYANANTALTYTLPAITPVQIRAITTSLLEIPVDKLFLYMNYGEFNSLEPGAHATSVNVSVIQRNPRVAFETNESTTTLATLNQNKFGIRAIGLNTNSDVRMMNCKYSAGTGATSMIPVTSTVMDTSDYDIIDSAMYGLDQSNVGFNATANIPTQPFMIPIHTNSYAVFLNTTGGTVNATPQGWYDISKYIDQFDMGATVGTAVANYSYNFKAAPLTDQLPFNEYISGTMGGINMNNIIFNDHRVEKEWDQSTIGSIASITTSAPTEANINITSSKNNYTNKLSAAGFRAGVPLEKVQYLKRIDSNSDTSNYVQPSLHVGISPVPRLTPGATDTALRPTSWTDVQAYFEVTAHMEVAIPFGHHNTHANTWNQNINGILMGAAQNTVVPILPSRMGHYVQS